MRVTVAYTNVTASAHHVKPSVEPEAEDRARAQVSHNPTDSLYTTSDPPSATWIIR